MIKHLDVQGFTHTKICNVNRLIMWWKGQYQPFELIIRIRGGNNRRGYRSCGPRCQADRCDGSAWGQGWRGSGRWLRGEAGGQGRSVVLFKLLQSLLVWGQAPERTWPSQGRRGGQGRGSGGSGTDRGRAQSKKRRQA